MSDYSPTPKSNALWNLLLEKASRREIPTTYGELSQVYYGHQVGGQAFRYWLFQIHQNIEEYNRRERPKQKVPYLNELVIRNDTRRVGIGAPGKPEKPFVVAGKVLEISDARWREIGAKIGYQPSVGYAGYKPPSQRPKLRLGINRGQRTGGKRSGATWEARHYPLVTRLQQALSAEWKVQRCGGWQPDLLVMNRRTKKTVLFEVKPNSSTHNIITALGQSLAYNVDAKADKLVIAVPNSGKLLENKLRIVLGNHEVDFVDMDLNFALQVRGIVA